MLLLLCHSLRHWCQSLPQMWQFISVFSINISASNVRGQVLCLSGLCSWLLWWMWYGVCWSLTQRSFRATFSFWHRWLSLQCAVLSQKASLKFLESLRYLSSVFCWGGHVILSICLYILLLVCFFFFCCCYLFIYVVLWTICHFLSPCFASHSASSFPWILMWTDIHCTDALLNIVLVSNRASITFSLIFWCSSAYITKCDSEKYYTPLLSITAYRPQN